MLLNACVPVTAWPRRARVRLVLVALEQLSDRGLVFLFSVYKAGNLSGSSCFLLKVAGKEDVRKRCIHVACFIVYK